MSLRLKAMMLSARHHDRLRTHCRPIRSTIRYRELQSDAKTRATFLRVKRRRTCRGTAHGLDNSRRETNRGNTLAGHALEGMPRLFTSRSSYAKASVTRSLKAAARVVLGRSARTHTHTETCQSISRR